MRLRRTVVSVRLEQDEIAQLRQLAPGDPEDPAWGTGLAEALRRIVRAHLAEQRRLSVDERKEAA